MDSAEDLETYQAFMLGGGNNRDGNSSSKKKKNKKIQHSSAPSPTVPRKATPNPRHQQTAQRQKTRKQYWQILNAFRKTLKEDWLDVDDHLEQVVASIVHLRDRINLTSKQLWRCQNTPTPVASRGGAGGFGFRKRSPGAVGHLTLDDLEMALSHGLIQHEKMLSGARKLVSSMNQAQEALGRRFDELLIYHLEIGYVVAEDEELAFFAVNSVEWCREVYAEMADELYRKQCLVQKLADSVGDGLIYKENQFLNDDNNPMKVAEKCLKDCARGGSKKNQEYLSELLSATPWEDM